MKTKPPLAKYNTSRLLYRGQPRLSEPKETETSRFRRKGEASARYSSHKKASSLLKRVDCVKKGLLNQDEANALAQKFPQKKLLYDEAKETLVTYLSNKRVECFIEECGEYCRFILYTKDHAMRRFGEDGSVVVSAGEKPNVRYHYNRTLYMPKPYQNIRDLLQREGKMLLKCVKEAFHVIVL